MDKKSNINIDRYEDPTGEFTTKELRASEWYVRHRVLLGKLGTGSLVAICVLLNGYALLAWGNYLFFGLVEDAAMESQVVASVQNYNRIKPLYQAQAFQVNEVNSFALGSDRYDFVANITNPNKRFLGELTYSFQYSGGKTEPRTTIMLPGRTRPVAERGVESSGLPAGIQFIIEDIKWKKINPHVVFDPEAYIDERLKFEFSNFDFVQKSAAADRPSNQMRFDIRNKSSYSFWQPTIYIELLNGTQTVGLMTTIIDKFLSGETRTVDLRNTTENLVVTDIRVHPYVNVFVLDEFMKVRVTETVPSLDPAPEVDNTALPVADESTDTLPTE